MTPPIHDREQAVEVVLAITFNNPVPGIKDALGARKRKEAEWIVDALSIGQPDPVLTGRPEDDQLVAEQVQEPEFVKRAEKAEAEVERLTRQLELLERTFNLATR